MTVEGWVIAALVLLNWRTWRTLRFLRARAEATRGLLIERTRQYHEGGWDVERSQVAKTQGGKRGVPADTVRQPGASRLLTEVQR